MSVEDINVCCIQWPIMLKLYDWLWRGESQLLFSPPIHTQASACVLRERGQQPDNSESASARKLPYTVLLFIATIVCTVLIASYMLSLFNSHCKLITYYLFAYKPWRLYFVLHFLRGPFSL